MDYLSVLSNLVAVAALFLITCPNESKGFVSLDYNWMVDYNAEAAEQKQSNPWRVLPLKNMDEISKKYDSEMEPNNNRKVLNSLPTGTSPPAVTVSNPEIDQAGFKKYFMNTNDLTAEHSQKLTEQPAGDHRSNRALSVHPESSTSDFAHCKSYGRFRKLCILNVLAQERERLESKGASNQIAVNSDSTVVFWPSK